MINLSKKEIEKIFKKHSLGLIRFKKRLREGFSNPIYVINDKIVLKIGKDSNELKFEKEKFLFELIHKKTDLPVPKIIALDSSKKIIPYEYILLEKLPGVQLRKALLKLSKTQKKKLAYELGLSLGKIHSIHFRNVGHFKGNRLVKDITWLDFVLDIYNNSIGKIKKYNLLKSELINIIESFIEQNKSLLHSKFRPTLIHSDYNTRNILTYKGKISGILDMEWSFSGHSEFDLSTMNKKIISKISKYKKYFFEGYESKVKRPQNHKKFESFYGVIYFLNIICWIHDKKVNISLKKYIKEIKRMLSKNGTKAAEGGKGKDV